MQQIPLIEMLWKQRFLCIVLSWMSRNVGDKSQDILATKAASNCNTPYSRIWPAIITNPSLCNISI